ncbi:hypothetical protein PSE10B_53250 [Pseudomonas amygdali pv. eriobotryae]|nr:hypothetical protein PSE10B_53250 [Pseudomonas amygdali pv. eriobotryae]GFZ74801.1 hypothetical protein PSE10C_55430 [Pseudomonas amygdali pv. eriobotryae]
MPMRDGFARYIAANHVGANGRDKTIKMDPVDGDADKLLNSSAQNLSRKMPVTISQGDARRYCLFMVA